MYNKNNKKNHPKLFIPSFKDFIKINNNKINYK